jgi:hypothetical protein
MSSSPITGLDSVRAGSGAGNSRAMFPSAPESNQVCLHHLFRSPHVARINFKDDDKYSLVRGSRREQADPKEWGVGTLHAK